MFDPDQDYAADALKCHPRYLLEIVCKETPYCGSYFSTSNAGSFESLSLLAPRLPQDLTLPIPPSHICILVQFGCVLAPQFSFLLPSSSSFDLISSCLFASLLLLLHLCANVYPITWASTLPEYKGIRSTSPPWTSAPLLADPSSLRRLSLIWPLSLCLIGPCFKNLRDLDNLTIIAVVPMVDPSSLPPALPEALFA